MRIIAGEYRGRRLMSPADQRVRPTSDKVKEAIFNTLRPWIGDGVVVDLFTGSGSLGLEALSRGAAEVVFADASRESLALARKNGEICKVGREARYILGDWQRVLESLDGPIDVFLLDPPYKEGILAPCLREIADRGLLAEDGVIMAEYSMDYPPEELPEAFGVIRDKHYGKTGVLILGYAGQEEE